MKIREGFVLTEIGDDIVAVPTGDFAEHFHGVVMLNKTAAVVWRGIEAGKTEEEIARSITERFDGVDYPKALDAIKKVIDKLKTGGLFE